MKPNQIVITYNSRDYILTRVAGESKHYQIAFETDRWSIRFYLLQDGQIRIIINKFIKKSETQYHTHFCYDCYCTLGEDHLFLDDVHDPATCRRITNPTKWYTINPMLREIYSQLKEELKALHPFDLIHDIGDLNQFIFWKMKEHGIVEFTVNDSLRFGIGENAYTTSEEALKAKEKEPLVLLNLFNGNHIISQDTIIFFLYHLLDRDGQLTISEEGKPKTVFITPIKKPDEWWDSTTSEVKSLFSGYPAETEQASFWKQLQESDRNNIYQYYQHQTGKTKLQEDDAHSLLMEIICELADISLEKEYNIPLEEMCNDDGSFLEKYQDRFNDLYDDIEDRILNYDFVTE